MNLQHLSQIAIEAAKSAGKIIQNHINDDLKVQLKEGGSSFASQVVTEIDKLCEQAILSIIKPSCAAFNLALLSEETEDDGSRFEKEYFWCIDPLDGTLPFINKWPGFAVSIALVAKDGTPQLGVVYDPSNDNLYNAIKGFGAFKNEQAWSIQPDPQAAYLTYLTDKKLMDTPKANEMKALLTELCKNLGLSKYKEISGAGSVMNAILALEHAPACMIKFPKKEQGGGSVWDYAATACIYQELGFKVTNFIGGKLDLNKRDGSFMNDEGVFYLVDSG
jgi:fructose-1,6-bisphosphatase/inositol monophosphatase family enzyme